MNNNRTDDTIVAVSTPVGEGGIGIVRLSGPGALAIADKIFIRRDGKKPSCFKTYTMHYGLIVDTNHQSQTTNHLVMDEVLLTVMRAPRSYTKEDIVEINCHGGIQAVRKVMELAVRRGSRVADPGEFTKRAFLNGRLDLAQAEAVLDVIRAKTEVSLKVAVEQLKGGLSKSVNDIREAILDIASEIEASIDFPEEDIVPGGGEGLAGRAKSAIEALKKLIDSYAAGAVLKEGVLAIICGKPNVGKSSLMNLLLKRDRVIVSPVPGTTRDAVEEMINIKGVPIRLVDTAGIAKTEDAVEREGVRRSRGYLGIADIVILVLDASSGMSKADRDIIRSTGGKKRLVVFNKTDIAKKRNIDAMRAAFKDDNPVEISIKKKKNIDLLERALLDAVWRGGYEQESEAGIVTSARHKELLDRALDNMLSVSKSLNSGLSPELVAVDLREAVGALDSVLGRAISHDMLDRIFAQFCIGK